MAEPYTCILRISDEKTMQLIDLYQKEECLWNTTAADYRNKVKRSEAAQKIARALDIPQFGARHVIMKFKNLRNSYSQELKKIAASKANGDGKYQPSVFWYKKMNSFIRPHLQPPRGAPHTSLVYLLDGTEHWAQIASPEEVMMTESIEPSGSENECDTHIRKRKGKKETKSTPKRFRGDSDSDEQNTIAKPRDDVDSSSEDDQQKTIARSLKELSTSLHLLMSRNDDYFDSFGKYIAGLLRSLPHRKALEVQPQIISLITAAGLQNLATREESEDSHLSFIKLEK